MADERKEKPELEQDEIDELAGEQLPDREVMSVINPAVDGVASFAPVDPAELP